MSGSSITPSGKKPIYSWVCVPLELSDTPPICDLNSDSDISESSSSGNTKFGKISTVSSSYTINSCLWVAAVASKLESLVGTIGLILVKLVKPLCLTTFTFDYSPCCINLGSNLAII